MEVMQKINKISELRENGILSPLECAKKLIEIIESLCVFDDDYNDIYLAATQELHMCTFDEFNKACRLNDEEIDKKIERMKENDVQML